jgi:hypothetical protein
MRAWTKPEEAALRVLSPLGGKACAFTFDRSLKSIERKAARLGVSLRRRTCGGNPGETSPSTLRRVRELSEASLCPACGFRFIGVKLTGLCGPCHVKGLKTVHEEEIKRVEAQRDLWAARSRLQRRRRQLEAVKA